MCVCVCMYICISSLYNSYSTLLRLNEVMFCISYDNSKCYLYVYK